jgi:hypothetical protein
VRIAPDDELSVDCDPSLIRFCTLVELNGII